MKVDKAFGVHSLEQTFHNGPSKTRAFINQAGVNLDQGGPGSDLFPCVSSVENAAHADDGKRATSLFVNVPDDFRAASPQGASAQSARLGIDSLQCGILGFGTADRCICSNNAGEPATSDQFQNVIESLKRKIGGDFHEDCGRSV